MRGKTQPAQDTGEERQHATHSAPPSPWPSTSTRRPRAPENDNNRTDNAPRQNTHGWVGGCKNSRGEEEERTHAAMHETSLSSRHESSLVLAETLSSSAQCSQF